MTSLLPLNKRAAIAARAATKAQPVPPVRPRTGRPRPPGGGGDKRPHRGGCAPCSKRLVWADYPLRFRCLSRNRTGETVHWTVSRRSSGLWLWVGSAPAASATAQRVASGAEGGGGLGV